MFIHQLIEVLEKFAPPALQEDYDNARQLTGDPGWTCTGVLVSLDVTEDVIADAVANKCNLVIAHHPVIFRGLKSLTGKNYVERTVIKAIKEDVAIYAIHTNLDNVIRGVSGKMAEKLGLTNVKILDRKQGILQKLVVFVPDTHAEKVRHAMFAAGAGDIGQYTHCSFSAHGTGTFTGKAGTDPFIGTPGVPATAAEQRVEVILPGWNSPAVLAAMRREHPYEEVAYDLYNLANAYQETGSGVIGEFEQPMLELDFLRLLGETFGIECIKHTGNGSKQVKKVALCGGAGSFLTQTAIRAGADAYVTADVKYHEFFDAGESMLLADIGHYESEQFTIDLLYDLLQENFPNFAVLKTGVDTNPVRYFTR